MTFPETGEPAAEMLTAVPPVAGPPEGALAAPPRTDVPTKPLAMSRAFAASPAEATEPIRMIESATVFT